MIRTAGLAEERSPNKEESTMKQYLLSIYQPDGDPPPPAVLAEVRRQLDVINQELRLTGAEIDRVFRNEHGQAVAVLVRIFGDIHSAEEAVQDAFAAAAVQHWPTTGLPPRPAGWIITTARNRAIDRLRREASRDDRHAQAVLLQASADEPFEEG